MEVDLLQSTTGVDLARILCSIVQSLAVVETSALLAQNSLLWHLLVKRCQMDGVEMFSGFTAIDKRFPFGALNRVEKTAAEGAKDSGEGEDSDDSDDSSDDGDEDDDSDGEESEDNDDSDAEANSDDESDGDSDSDDNEDDDEDDDDDDDDEEDDDSDEDDEGRAQPPSRRKK